MGFLTILILFFLILYLYRKILLDKLIFKMVDREDEVSVKGKTILITGANTGIGKETAREIADRGGNVILGCRNLEKAEKAIQSIKEITSNGTLTAIKLDLNSLDSVREFAKIIKDKYEKLDILILNAGRMLPPDSKREFTKDSFESHFGVNHLSHFLLANLLLDLVKKSDIGRIVTLGSIASMKGVIDFKDLQFKNKKIVAKNKFDINQFYANSKLANALFSYELSRRLEKEGSNVKTYCLCPGVVATDIARDYTNSTLDFIILYIFTFLFLKTSNQGCQTTLFCALSKKVSNQTGKMYRHCGIWEDSKFYFDTIFNPFDKIGPKINSDDSEKLWEASKKLVGL